MLDPRMIGMKHYEVARATIQKLLQDYKGLQDIIAILGMDGLSEDDMLTDCLPCSQGPKVHVSTFPRCRGFHRNSWKVCFS